MNAERLKALHRRERELWAIKEDVELDVALAKRDGASDRAGVNGAEAGARAAEALAKAQARRAEAIREWSIAYQEAKCETRAFIEALGLEPERVRVLLAL